MQKYLEYSKEVQKAIQTKSPILALESTVITHGLPYPTNLETALLLEELARQAGVTPATIAVIGGKIKIGLSHDELTILVHDEHVIKAGPRDLSYAISQNLNAGTTVASSIYAAANAQIKVFATGGIGGVHRGDDQDISADLIELGRTPIAVVCAGAKAILDLPRTLEFLETYSVPVIGYKTDTLPAFFTHSTRYKLGARADDIETLAAIIQTHWQLGMRSGLLIANPIPELDGIAAEMVEPVIANALKKAEEQKISGKAMTPFLLNEVTQSTQGKSLTANIALLKNNVQMGAELALALK